MSSYTSDENNDSSLDFLLSIDRCRDSGYLTFTSSCATSPSRQSPSHVILQQLDSPVSEHDLQSPVKPPRGKFLSTVDYEQYRSTRKHFDIVTQLNHRNAYHLIDQILENLSNNDLSHCSQVCRKWYLVLKDYFQRKNIKRNLFHPNKKTPNRKTKLTSTPMKPITNLLEIKSTIPLIVESMTDENTNPSKQEQNSSPENNIHLTASTMTFRYGYLKYLHGPTVPKRCPICAYVSIVDVNDQHG